MLFISKHTLPVLSALFFCSVFIDVRGQNAEFSIDPDIPVVCDINLDFDLTILNPDENDSLHVDWGDGSIPDLYDPTNPPPDVSHVYHTYSS